MGGIEKKHQFRQMINFFERIRIKINIKIKTMFN